MSRERKSLRGTSGLRSPISHTHTFYSLSLLFRFLPIRTSQKNKKQKSPCSYLILLLLTSLASFNSFNRHRAGEAKSDSYDSSKMQFDVLRLLLEAEGVVNDSNTRKGGGRKRGEWGRKSTRVYKINPQIPPSPLVSFYRTCYLINVVLNFILYNNNNN